MVFAFLVFKISSRSKQKASFSRERLTEEKCDQGRTICGNLMMISGLLQNTLNKKLRAKGKTISKEFEH